MIIEDDEIKHTSGPDLAKMTAAEAAKLADESIFSSIKEAIRDAADRGEFHTEVNHINDRHKAKLDAQGYIIEESENKLGKKYLIKFPLPE